jgi:hypothetical protein
MVDTNMFQPVAHFRRASCQPCMAGRRKCWTMVRLASGIFEHEAVALHPVLLDYASRHVM